MRVLLTVLCVALVLATPARASDRTEVVRNVLLWTRDDVGVSPEWELPFEARLGLYTGAAAAISFVELGDKSPLKDRIGESAWNQLKERLPMIQQAAASLLPGLVADVRAELDKAVLDRQSSLTLAAGAMLLPASDEPDLFQKGSLIYGCKALASLALHPTVFTRLTRLAIDPSTPRDVRDTAGGLVTAGGILKAQLYLAEARYRYEVGAEGAAASDADRRLLTQVLLFD